MTKEKHFYLIRGLIREREHWGSFITHLRETFPGATITTLDIPGAGDHYLSPSPLSIGKMVEEMRRDYLQKKFPQEESFLVAISLGGMIAVEWMKNHPEDFQRGVLINTSFGGLSPVFQRLRPRAIAHLLKVFVLKGREKEARILELVTNHREHFQKTLDRWERIQRERPVSLTNTLKQLTAAASYRIGDFTPSIPLLVLAASQDRMVNVACSRAIARHWRLPLEEHPSGGHDLTSDDPEWVVEKIKGFAAKDSFSPLAEGPRE